MYSVLAQVMETVALMVLAPGMVTVVVPVGVVVMVVDPIFV